MNNSIKEVWIEQEHWGPADRADLGNSNSDVIVTLFDGTRHVATFFTYENIQSLRSKNRISGECLGGKYFWASDMIIIDSLDRENILVVIDELLRAGEFRSIFAPVLDAL